MDKYEVIKHLHRFACGAPVASDEDIVALQTAADMLLDENTIVISDTKGNTIATVDGKLADDVVHMAVSQFITTALERVIDEG